MKIWSATVLFVISIGCTASSIPATGEPVGTFPRSGAEDVDRRLLIAFTVALDALPDR